MKNLFLKLKVLGELILTFSGIYAAIVFSFSSLLVNLLLIVVSLFILSQALGTIDEINGYNKKSTGFPADNHNHTTGFPDSNHHPGLPDNNDDYDSGTPDIDSPSTDDLNNDYPIPE